MQFSELWLRQYVNPSISSDALSHALTMSGLEVEAMEDAAVAFDKVVVAEIISAEKHPDADRLQICRVNVGAAQPLQIVCGATNARAGLKAPCALVGAELPGFNIKQAKVRGVESFGMMCSAKELGLAEQSSGLLELSVDAPVGADIRSYLELNDKIFTLKLTPNRSDCLSIIGVAREVGALTGATVSLPEIQAAKIDIQITKPVAIEAADACLRYCGRLIEGVNANARTPDWMVRRLERSGLRSINAIVDITNYVLLEMGQPMHAFDASTLQGAVVSVRYAKPGETIELLNQQKVELHPDMLVISDAAVPVALAGVMGGAATAVTDNTRDIFLESAFFTPDAIVGKARRLGLSTDSSYRFERGVDYGNTLLAMEHATALIQKICGGAVGPVVEVAGDLPARQPVKLHMGKLLSVLGIQIDEATVAQLFTQLGFDFQHASGVFTVTPPSYRFDINIEEDLVEEIARLYGYDKIPATAPISTFKMLPDTETSLSRHVLRDALVASDYQEVVTYSFVDESWERDLLGNPNAIPLKNPIASNMSVMRSGLWGGLLDALVYNLNRKQERVRLFEIGATYQQVVTGYSETLHISGLAYGDASPEQWAQAARQIDFYDIKADVDVLTGHRAEYQAAQHPALHPGQSAQVLLNGVAVGWIGKLHPKWQQHYQLPKATVLFELAVDPLLKRNLPQYQEVAKFPPVRRDMAVLVDETVSVQAIIKTMKNTNLPHVSEIGLFDVYRGKGIPETKKSLAFLVLMQDTQKTLTDTEADAVMAALLESIVREHGAELR